MSCPISLRSPHIAVDGTFPVGEDEEILQIPCTKWRNEGPQMFGSTLLDYSSLRPVTFKAPWCLLNASNLRLSGHFCRSAKSRIHQCGPLPDGCLELSAPPPCIKVLITYAWSFLCLHGLASQPSIYWWEAVKENEESLEDNWHEAVKLKMPSAGGANQRQFYNLCCRSRSESPQ